MPNHPLIQQDLHRETLERVMQVLELMQYLDLSKGMDSQARQGMFRLQQMLADAVRYVGERLRNES